MIKNFFKNIDPSFYDYLIVFFFGIVVFMGALGEAGLRNDDIHYAAIAKSVLDHDNFMILHRNDEIYLSKPPLYFWLTAVSLKVFGITVFGAKFVSALCAVFILLIIFKMAKDAFDNNSNAGYGAVLFFTANYMVYKVSHGVRLESLLTLGVTAGIYFAGQYLSGMGRRNLYVAGFFCGTAVLTKGYLGIMAFLAVVAGVVYYRNKINDNNKKLALIITIIIFTGTFAWWYYYAFTHTDFFHKFFIKESLNRLETGDDTWDSVPFYKYTLMLIKFSFLAFPFVFIALRRHADIFRKNFSLAIMTVFTVVYFIIIHFLTTKFGRYLYPVAVLISIIGGIGLASVIRFRLKPYILGISITFACIFAVYPGTYGDTGYRELTNLEKTALLNNGAVCADEIFLERWENRAGIYFFTKSFKSGECAPNDIIIQKKNTDCGGITLIKNSRITACTEQ